jgi:hypothetical protein
MGHYRYDRELYNSVASAAARHSKDIHQTFENKKVINEFNPLDISVRESVDSEANPESTAIIIGLDVTGSMGMIAHMIARDGLGQIMEGILDNKPVTDPHVLYMAIGDINHDRAPLQVTQFESHNILEQQLTSLWLEGGGGGNHFESYDLPWAFAANKTKIDCFDKRNKKGYLFTIGDEEVPQSSSIHRVKDAIGIDGQINLTAEEYLKAAQKMYHVFHITIEEGGYARHRLDSVRACWKELLGKKAIFTNNYKFLPQIITAIIQVNEGENPQEVLASIQDERTRNAVKYALFGD